MIAATLVIGASASAREAAIAASLDPGVDTAVILEGLPDAHSSLDACSTRLRVARIVAGCACCTGNLAMRVTLNRMIRGKPRRLYIGLASSLHIEQVRAFLCAAPYDDLLALTKDLQG